MFNKIFNPIISPSTRDDREISDSSTLSKVLKQSGIGAKILIPSAIVGFLTAFYGFYGLVAGVSIVFPMFFGMVNSESCLLGNSKENVRNLIDEHLEVYEKSGQRLYSKVEISKITGLSVNEIKAIIMEYYNELTQGKQYLTPELMHELTFGRTTTAYKAIEQLCVENGFELVTTQNEWLRMLQESGKPAHKIKVLVKCLTEEAHVTSKTIASIGKHGCLYCNGRYKNQRITHAISEALFGMECEKEVNLVDKLEEIGVDPNYEEYRAIMDVFRMSLDTFIELNIKDEFGNVIANILRDKENNIIKDKYGNEEIHLAIESQGPQHYDNDAGFKSFLYLNKFKGEPFNEDWWSLKDEWDR